MPTKKGVNEMFTPFLVFVLYYSTFEVIGLRSPL